MAGYSGTPLTKKLGIREGRVLYTLGAPSDYRDLLAPLPAAVECATAPTPATDIAHVFVSRREDLARVLATLRTALRADAAVWVSWPKQAAKLPTDVTEDVVRALALPMGFVDIKVCAVTDVWSGLQLVVRKELR